MSPITAALVHSQQIQKNNYFTSLPPPMPALMFALFNNPDSISPCRQVHFYRVIHCPNLDCSGCTERFKRGGAHIPFTHKCRVINQIIWTERELHLSLTILQTFQLYFKASTPVRIHWQSPAQWLAGKSCQP